MPISPRILALLEDQMDRGLYQGASLAFYDKGKWTDCYLGEFEPGQKTREGLIYDLASVSKVVGVGTLLIRLLLSGELSLDQTLQSLYPAVKNPSITLRQLVTHTSGIDPFIPNRDELDQSALKKAILNISVGDQKDFHYTDLNLILLGFMLEERLGADLAVLFQRYIFQPWGMTETSFGPIVGAVPTRKGQRDGQVHDPKAQVLGAHTGSAGLFSTLRDLKRFLEHYLQDDFAANLYQNVSPDPQKARSIVWDLQGDWLDHTGYTGPFIAFNRRCQQAVIFLTNRTYFEDNRALWIQERRRLYQEVRQEFAATISL
ncbi:serine hydrolase domain-containing protein [Streptococcus sp. DD13]|uniref:serine hydrolase domain-containing protein n=1 Tax=Streptococcus sp. DD13 TaxID=1777881 RepID=UPI000794FF9C|nr:serine hydrolase domain-containing protein [Streptococcus sp. DD13]KXT77977.1 Beta-lactamase, class C [Streptococcus sp. DD13]